MTAPRLPLGIAILSLLLLPGASPGGVDARHPPAGTILSSPARADSPAVPGGASGRALQGEALATALGCGGCHAGLPASDIPDRAPAFGAGAPPVAAEFVFTYLADPVPRRLELTPARMPDFGLDEDERLALALFLAGDAEGPGVGAARGRHPDVEAEDGRLLFAGLGCRGCHVHPEVGPAPETGPDLSDAGRRYRDGWVEGFLAEPATVRPSGHRPGTGSRMPDFRLEAEEVASLSDYLATLRGGPDPAALARAREGAGSPSRTPSPWALHRAERYLTERLSCLGCHGWRGGGGRVAPALDGLSDRLTPDAIAAAVHAPAEARPGTVMPPSPFRPGIRDEVVALLVSDSTEWTGAERVSVPWPERRGILRAWSASRTDAETDADRESPASGTGLYGRRCAACHGVGGDGQGFNRAFLPVAPTAHADPAVMSLRPDDTLYDGIASGGWVLDRSPRMPAFGGALSPERIRSLVAHIRELCDCEGPSWSGTGGAP